MKDNYNEGKALKLLIAGDERGLKMIHDRYAYNVFLIGRKYLLLTELAEDLVQDVFNTLWTDREKLNNVVAFREHLFTIVKNEAMHRIKQQASVNKTIGEYKIIRKVDQ